MLFRDTDVDIDAIALREGWVTASPLGLSLLNAPGVEQVGKWKLWS